MHDQILPYNMNTNCISLGMSFSYVITVAFKSTRKETIRSFLLLFLARCEVRDGTH